MGVAIFSPHDNSNIYKLSSQENEMIEIQQHLVFSDFTLQMLVPVSVNIGEIYSISTFFDVFSST